MNLLHTAPYCEAKPKVKLGAIGLVVLEDCDVGWEVQGAGIVITRLDAIEDKVHGGGMSGPVAPGEALVLTMSSSGRYEKMWWIMASSKASMRSLALLFHFKGVEGWFRLVRLDRSMEDLRWI